MVTKLPKTDHKITKKKIKNYQKLVAQNFCLKFLSVQSPNLK